MTLATLLEPVGTHRERDVCGSGQPIGAYSGNDNSPVIGGMDVNGAYEPSGHFDECTVRAVGEITISGRCHQFQAVSVLNACGTELELSNGHVKGSRAIGGCACEKRNAS